MTNVAKHIRSLALVLGIAAGAWTAAGHHMAGHFTATQRVEVGALMAVIILVAGLILAALVSAGARSRRPASRQAAPPRQRSYGGSR